jgi:hypothetical protein
VTAVWAAIDNDGRPLTNPEASLARNTAACAISSERPARGIGWIVAKISLTTPATWSGLGALKPRVFAEDARNDRSGRDGVDEPLLERAVPLLAAPDDHHLAPSETNALAIPSPMPLVRQVTIAIFGLRSPLAARLSVGEIVRQATPDAIQRSRFRWLWERRIGTDERGAWSHDVQIPAI